MSKRSICHDNIKYVCCLLDHSLLESSPTLQEVSHEVALLIVAFLISYQSYAGDIAPCGQAPEDKPVN